MIDTFPCTRPEPNPLAHGASATPASDGLGPEPARQQSTASTAVLQMLQACTSGAQAGVDDGSAPPGRATLLGLPADVAIGDWDVLLSAVKARLRLTVGELRSATPEWPAQGAAGRVQAQVLECVAALDQLHTTLTHEVGRRQQLELEVFDARTALAQARAELAGTQGGVRQARHLALHDKLTSLPNRTFFGERLQAALALAEPQRGALAVLTLDLDGFTTINEAHGQEAGDELLRVVAARLVRAVRAEDMVSRLGSDAFALLLSNVSSREHLSHLACKLFDAVSAPLQIGSLNLTLRPSIGISTSPTDGADCQALLANADIAMLRAKRQQTGYAFFDECAPARVA